MNPVNDAVNAGIAEMNRRPGIRNLQTHHSHHPTVGLIIQHSVDHWLTGPQVYRLLRRRIDLMVSGNENPHRGVLGLYLFYCHRFFNYRNGFLDRRLSRLSHRHHRIRVTQTRPVVPIAPTYVRRSYRCTRFGRFVLVHYLIV